MPVGAAGEIVMVSVICVVVKVPASPLLFVAMLKYGLDWAVRGFSVVETKSELKVQPGYAGVWPGKAPVMTTLTVCPEYQAEIGETEVMEG